MTDANRTRVGIVEELTFGVIPTSPAFEILRFTSSSLVFNPTTVTSSEIRSDRQVSDLILVGAEASGDLGFELSFGSYDTLFEGAFFNDWVETPSRKGTQISNVNTTPGAIAVTSGGAAFLEKLLVKLSGFSNSANNKVVEVTSGGSGTSVPFVSPSFTSEASPPSTARMKVVGIRGEAGDVSTNSGGKYLESAGDTVWTNFTYSAGVRDWGLRAGMWVKLKGLATAANNGYARILSVTATRITFDIVPAGWATETAPVGSVDVLFGDYIRNGIVEKSYTVQQAFLANSQYQYLRGMEVASMAVSLESQAIMTGTFSMSGKDGQYVAASFTGNMAFADPTDIVAVTNGVPNSATLIDASTADVLNTSSNVGRIAEGGNRITGPNYVNSAQFTIENNLRMQNAIGSLGAIGIGVGTCTITGTLNAYFGDTSLLAKVINNLSTSFDFVVGRDDTGYMLFDMPRVKFSSGTTPVSGINTDVMQELGFQAVMDKVLGYQIHCQKFEYV